MHRICLIVFILQTIGQYHSSGKGRCGGGSGIIGGADHFDEDHSVTTCRTGYYFMQQDLAVSIKVEQHTGGDSDRWLLHEVDADFRNYYGISNKSYAIVPVNGNPILEYGSAGWDYRWISGNKVININYHDSQMTKPEPLEVIQAYLAKHPSTIAPMTLQQLRSDENVIKWIKDEMDRRLWLCDKWNAQFQAGKATQSDLIYNLDRSMGVFLNYRQKYYGVSAKSDLEALSGYKQKNDIAFMQKKLTEYKKWWAKYKDENISLK